MVEGVQGDIGGPAAKSTRLPCCRPGKYHAAGLRQKIVFSLLPKQKYGAGRNFLKKYLTLSSDVIILDLVK